MVIRQLCDLAGELLQNASGPVVGIGLATPGIVDSRTGFIRFVSAELPGWADLAVVETIARCFELPVLADNDGRAAAVAKHLLRSGQGLHDFVTIVIGTGIGGSDI